MKICIFLIAITSVLCVSCREITIGESSLRSVSLAANDFTNNFYKAVVNRTEGNLICSPIGVDIVLSMISFGARGNTEKQLESSLNLPCDKSVTKQGYQQLIKTLNNAQGVELKLANKIFVNNGASLQPDFSETTKTYFESETQSVDFTKAVEAAKTINDWSAEETNNRITELFKPDEIENASIVLANAVYFKGKWANKFNPKRTRSSPFKVDDETTKNVPTMRNGGTYNHGYLSDAEAHYIELPYESKDESEAISMFIFLPRETAGLRDLESNIHKINFTELKGYTETLFLSLPKFKIESQINLEPVLKNMGIRNIFEKSADLSRITGHTDLKVDKSIQKAFIEVNEEGSEAAAVTGFTLIALSATEVFHVNRPFLSVIVKKKSGTPLFIARIIDPTI